MTAIMPPAPEGRSRAARNAAAGDATATARLELEGYLYIIQFDKDLIKVGYTATPARRIDQHRSAAAAYGHAVTRIWVSQPHFKARANERLLIKHCAGKATGRNRDEYFFGLAFDDIVAFVENLDLRRVTDEEIASSVVKSQRSLESLKRSLGWGDPGEGDRIIRLPARTKAHSSWSDLAAWRSPEIEECWPEILQIPLWAVRLIPDHLLVKAVEAITACVNINTELTTLRTLLTQAEDDNERLTGEHMNQLRAEIAEAVLGELQDSGVKRGRVEKEVGEPGRIDPGKLRIAEIRRVYSACHPGVWQTKIKGDRVLIVSECDDEEVQIAAAGYVSDIGAVERACSITALHAVVPAMCDEIDWLRAEVTYLRAGGPA